MYIRRAMAAGLVALCLSGDYTSVSAEPHIQISASQNRQIYTKPESIKNPKEAETNLQKRINEFLANSDSVNVYLSATNKKSTEPDYIPLYSGPTGRLERLGAMMLSNGVLTKRAAFNSLFAQVSVSIDYEDAAIKVIYEHDEQELVLQLDPTTLDGIKYSIR